MLYINELVPFQGLTVVRDQDIPNFMWKGQGGDMPQNIPLMMFKLLICLTSIPLTKLTNILQQRRPVHSSTVAEVKLQITRGLFSLRKHSVESGNDLSSASIFGLFALRTFPKLTPSMSTQCSGNINTASPLSSSKSDSLHQKS